MKNTTLVLLCCSALLAACDKSSDTTNTDSADSKGESLLDKASSVTGSALDSAKETASGTMGAAKDAATDAASEAMTSGKDLKDTAMESASAAVDSAKETVGAAVDSTINTAKEVTSAAVDKTSDVVASVRADDKQGESVYKKSCVACHATGVAGSPKLGDKAAWESRIAQGSDVMTKHAIEGFKGSTGYMPAKGGFMSLSDDDVVMAVQYMVSQSQ